MYQYLDLVDTVLQDGELTGSRTGVDTLSAFGQMMKFDLRAGFPILTTKKILWPTVVDELLWFIKGGHNIHDDRAPKRIWDDWASPSGDLGRIYGVQWRDWQTFYPERELIGENIEVRWYPDAPIDQLELAISRVKRLPNSRRNIVSAWNVGDVENQSCSFPPCHVLFQLRRYGDFLDLAMYQRSADIALGVPFNISSYSLLLSMIAHECGLIARKFVHFLADAHIYTTHIDGLKKQLQREPHELPRLQFTCPVGTRVTEMTREMISLEGYNPQPFIKFPIAV
jgi:thymidylate synthase